ncbi:MAG: DUF2922 domain-containing protein [Sarcina sp.]
MDELLRNKVESNLMLVFSDANGKNVSLTLRNAGTGLTTTEVGGAMDEVIASGCILTSTGDAVANKVKYAYVDKNTTELTIA